MRTQYMTHSNNNSTALKAQNVSVVLGGHIILNKINFALREGDIATIVGPNGAGKTTLLKAILGIIPHTGKITIFGEKIRKSISKIGYVPQRFSFDKTFPLTVEEFLSLTVKRKNAETISKSLKEVEMQNYKNKMIGELSGGQLQRILIARALLHNPKILLLDEPTTGVDIEGMRTFYEIIEHLNKNKNVTIVIISHEINIVHKFSNYVLCLNKDLYCKGAPKEVITDEVLKRLYGENFELRPHSHNH